MLKPLAFLPLLATLAATGCGSDSAPVTPAGAGGGVAGASAGAGGSPAGGAGGASRAGAGPTAGGGSAGSAAGGAGTGGSLAGAGAGAGAGGSMAGAAGALGTAGAAGSVNTVPSDYKGTAFALLQIPGKINAADYDRGGPGIAWCHDKANCSAGTVTGDYPNASGVYRPPVPANGKVCGGAACDENVGVCRMNPSKPDNTIAGQPMPATDTYLCYSVAGEWTKYTVVVAQAGTYAVGGVMAVPQGGGMNLSFGNNITTGDVALAITSTEHSGSGENYHSWESRSGLASVTFPSAGTYLMTFTQVGRFNADSFSFTKM
jgi:hypothetical protein